MKRPVVLFTTADPENVVLPSAAVTVALNPPAFTTVNSNDVPILLPSTAISAVVAGRFNASAPLAVSVINELRQLFPVNVATKVAAEPVVPSATMGVFSKRMPAVAIFPVAVTLPLVNTGAPISFVVPSGPVTVLELRS
jgi:hypothetical protein